MKFSFVLVTLAGAASANVVPTNATVPQYAPVQGNPNTADCARAKILAQSIGVNIQIQMQEQIRTTNLMNLMTGPVDPAQFQAAKASLLAVVNDGIALREANQLITPDQNQATEGIAIVANAQLTELRKASSLTGNPAVDMPVLQSLQQDFAGGIMQNMKNAAAIPKYWKWKQPRLQPFQRQRLERPYFDMAGTENADHIPAADLVPQEDGQSDADSDLGYGESSTASVASSILDYRTFKGRSYHSKTHASDYHVPLDEQALENFDLMHYFLTLLTDDKLHLAPIKPDAQTVLDIGTGTGIWAIDFADENPGISVIGTDLSPVQPGWVPPNLRFEIDDCTKEWTWGADYFDFVHMRYLFGGVKDWGFVFKEALRTLKPGAYLESVESDPLMYSDDGTLDGTVLGGKFCELFTEAGKITGSSLTVLADDIQRKAAEEAGFEDVQVVTYKASTKHVPLGSWPRDQRLAKIGQCAKMSLVSDLPGYTQLLWHKVLQWPAAEYEIFLMQLRKDLRNKNVHAYFKVRFVTGRKPE